MLDYDFVKNYYRVVAVNLSSQEELDDNTKVIWQIELLGQLKNWMITITLQMEEMINLCLYQRF